MLEGRVADEGSAIHHVHVLHALCDLLDADVAAGGGYAVALKDAFEPFQPFSAEPLALFVTAAGHGDDDVRGGVVVEEPLLKLRGVFVDFHFVGDGLRLPEAPKEGVERVDVLHHEHIIHADFHDAAAGGLDCVVGVPEVRRHHHPMGRYRPKLCRAACGVFLDDEVALALEEEVNLLEPPQGCCREFVQGVRLRQKLRKLCRVISLSSPSLPTT